MATRYAELTRDQLIRELINRDKTIETLRSLLSMTRARVTAVRRTKVVRARGPQPVD